MPKHYKSGKKKVKRVKTGKKKRRKQNKEFNDLFSKLTIQKKVRFDLDISNLSLG